MKREFEAIENYGIIGNVNTIALVSKKGSIDFMCFPQFDSPTIFASILDPERGGCFTLQPVLNNLAYKQLYLPDTAVLITRFFSDEGIAELTDFMPVSNEKNNVAVIRKITSIRGTIQYHLQCAPRFNYSTCCHKTQAENNSIHFIKENEGSAFLTLQSNITLAVVDEDVVASFSLPEGESAYFILQSPSEPLLEAAALKKSAKACFRSTNRFWKNWISTCSYKGRWREIVHRSAITLKLLSSQKYGSVVAAPTFSLPEAIGGVRNWDYRYTWIRDAAFTMYAFLQLGYIEEATAFINWIDERCMTKGLQLMYTIDGRTELEEQELPQFCGYKNSGPVRIGNAAFKQFQLDIYGELIDTTYIYNKHGGPIDFDMWQKIQSHVNFVCDNWQKEDHGIWEVRGGKKQFLHSRMMCWVALDRGIKIGNNRSFPYPREKWYKLRDEIYCSIYNDFWNEEVQAFVQYKGSDEVDASVLLMPLMRLVSPTEYRWKKTMEKVAKDLRLDVLLYRYQNKKTNVDGLDGEEGTFTMCSFWYVECLAKSGQIEKASEYFEKMLGYANHLGLFSEQLGKRGEHLGNYPQAFTHLALISAALQLDRSLDHKL